jgi:hypothetical protein
MMRPTADNYLNPLMPLSQNPLRPLREKIAHSSENNKNLFMPQVTQIHLKPIFDNVKPYRTTY